MSMKKSVELRRFVVFDLETTGLDPGRHEIIEIGAIRVSQNGSLQERFQTLVKPRNGIPKEITELTGISRTMVERKGQPLGDALRAFAAFIKRTPLISFNADFDMAFLLKAANRHRVVITNRSSCALRMARRAWPGRASYQLCDLAKHRHLSDEGTHRALGDCHRTVLIYIAAASKLRRMAGRRMEGRG